MELVTLAEAMARLGTLGVGTALLTIVALRLVRVDEVPGWVQVRIRWWHAHHTTFLVTSAAILAIGLAILATAG